MTSTDRAPQPPDGDERALAPGRLAFSRDALAATCADLTPTQLAERSAAPSALSLLGLVRHLAEMEHAYGSWPLTVDTDFEWIREYTDDLEGDVDCVPEGRDASLTAWREHCRATDSALAGAPDLSAVAPTTGRSIRWNLAKLLGEYARHCGHADLLRERPDGSTGERARVSRRRRPGTPAAAPVPTAPGRWP